MAPKTWTNLAHMRTPSNANAVIWMTEDGERRFTSTRQLMKYLRTTFLDREFKVISYSWGGETHIEIKYRYTDEWWL